jgi:hypothetical protein
MKCVSVCFALLWLAALPLCAQEPAVDLGPLKTRAELSEDDRNQVRAYITARISRLIGPDSMAARTATDELRAGFDGTATEGFKKAYAAIGLELLGPGIKKAELVPATRMLAVINNFGALDAVPVLLEALQDERVGVRAGGAVGLRALRPRIGANPELYGRVVGALNAAGKKEKARDTLKSIYAALDYAELPAPPDAKVVAPALLDLLEARAAAYNTTPVPAFGADDAGLRLAKLLVGSYEEADRKRLATAAATMMRYALEQYLGGESKLSAVRDRDGSRELIELRNGAERLVKTGEDVLVAALKPAKPPTVADALQNVKDKPAIRLQWQAWVALLQPAVSQDFSLRAGTDEAADEKPATETKKKDAAEGKKKDATEGKKKDADAKKKDK